MGGALCARRRGYQYAGVVFSEDGRKAWMNGLEYREAHFPAGRSRRFNFAIAFVILLTFPGIPLLAYFGFQRYFLAGFLVFTGLLFWFNRRIHRCVRCKRPTQQVDTPYDGAPVLFFCRRCRIFFEHGQIDGGWPGRG